MKKIFVLTAVAGAFFIGCAEKPMATSVVDLAGNQQVAGWDDPSSKEEKPKVKVVEKVKTVVKYKTKIKYKTKTVVKYKTEKDSDGDWVPDSVDKCPNTAPNLPVDHNGCPIITTLRLNFDFNKATVKKIYYPQIKQVAQVLKDNPHMKIEVAGYTDDIGPAYYNLKLSKKRAQAVKDILVKKYGIDPKRIIVKGYGEKYPLVPNTTSTNRALNRRVEIVNVTNKVEKRTLKDIKTDKKRISTIKTDKKEVKKPAEKKVIKPKTDTKKTNTNETNTSKEDSKIIDGLLKTISQIH